MRGTVVMGGFAGGERRPQQPVPVPSPTPGPKPETAEDNPLSTFGTFVDMSTGGYLVLGGIGIALVWLASLWRDEEDWTA